MLYIALMMLGTFLSGRAAPVRHADLSTAGSHNRAAVHRPQKVKSEGDLGFQVCSSARAGTSFRQLPPGLEPDVLTLPLPGARMSATVSRLGIPAAKHYLDDIYPSHHFW